MSPEAIRDGSHGDPAAQIARLEARARAEPRPHTRAPEKLAGLRRLLAALDHPERNGNVVHVAGTNGKGATAATIARLLAGDADAPPVGLFTSPHLADIRERIRIGGRLIAPEPFAAAIARVLDTAEGLPDLPRLAYFDLLTAIAFVAFREVDVGWRVLETGLGGMADATNVADKRLSVITPIGHDHQAVLGGDLRAIAEQKLGIVPPGGDVVLAPQPTKVAGWMAQTLAGAGSRVWQAAEIEVQPELPAAAAGTIRLRWPEGPTATLEAPPHRVTVPRLTALRTALRALDALRGAPADEAEAVRRTTLAWSTPLPGRQQWVVRATPKADPDARLGPLVLDGAHNPEALDALADQVERWNLTGYTLLITLLADKLTPGVAPALRRLLARADGVRGVLLPVERAADPARFAAFLHEQAPAGLRERIVLEPPDAALRGAANAGRPVVVAGSLWLVGEVLRRLVLGPGDDPTAPW